MSKDVVLKLSNNNKHLNNIFNDNCFFEMGNIEVEVIERLLDEEIVPIDEMSILFNKSLDKSYQTDEAWLGNLLPLLYLININLRNITKQIFITYGLLKHQRDKKEEFTPIILIPVKLYFDNTHRVLVRKISSPIINPYVIKYLGNKNLDLSSTNLKSIYDIDNFCVSLNKYNDVNVELENYFTFGEVLYRDYSINNFQFNLTIDDDRYANRLYVRGNNPLFVDKLNRKQRKALYASSLGKSFTIVGESGTGKTLTLKNILLNALYDGKKVLYLSNMKESLLDMGSFLNAKGLKNIYSNLEDQFDSLRDNDKITNIEDLELKDIDLKDLIEKYDYIEEYENLVSGRILDHRFIEVLGELISLRNKDIQLLNIDDLSKIYKSEYERIVASLEHITKSLDKIGVFNESNWKAVPRINSINNSSVIMRLIEKIHTCFYSFKDLREVFEKEFDIIKINDYAMLRKIVNDINNIDIHLIPESWKTSDLVDYNKTSNEFKELKNAIYSYKEINRSIDQIINRDLIDINIEYDKLLGKYYSSEDLELIDRYFRNRKEINEKINRISESIDKYQNSIKTLNELCDYEFINDLDINELIRLKQFLDKYDVNSVINNVTKRNELDSYIIEAEQLINEINTINSDNKAFYLKYPKYTRFKTRDVLKLIEEYRNGNDKKTKRSLTVLLRRHLGRGIFEEQVDNIEKYISQNQRLRVLKEKYYNLVGKKYVQNNYYLSYLKEFKELYDNIYCSKIKEIILFILTKLEHDNNKSIIEAIGDLNKAIYDIKELEDILSDYNIRFSNVFSERVNESIEAISYLRGLYSSNDKLKKALKKKQDGFVSSKIYVYLKELFDSKDKLEQIYNGNQECIHLFSYLYRGLSTDVSKLSEVLDSYERFTKAFKNSSGYLECLENANYNKIKTYIDRFKATSSELNEVFKKYSHIFSDGVTRYFYTSLDEVLDYLGILVKSNDELDSYLEVTRGLRVLNEYNLNELIDYICETSDVTTLVDEFKYTYFKVLEESYLKKYPELLDYDKFNQVIKEVSDIEDVLVYNNEIRVLSKLRKEATKTMNFRKHYNNYSDFIRHNNKMLFLASSDISNLYLDSSKFDLVIIDDAHLLPSSAYGDMVLAKQVIICGEKLPHTSVINNLVSKTRSLATISLDYSYTKSTELVSKDNKQIKVLNSNIYDAIYKMYLDNNDVRINIYIKHFDLQKKFFDDFTNYFLNKEVSSSEILRLLSNNIVVSDLGLGYVRESEVNICNLEDYYNTDIDYISDNLLNYLLSSKAKVIIYDKDNLLSKKYSYRFFTEIKRIINDNNDKEIDLGVKGDILGIGEILRNKKYKVFVSSDELIYRYNKTESDANIILWGSNTTGDALNVYRDIYNRYNSLGFNSLFITKLEIAIDYEKSINKLKRSKNV